MSARDAFQLAFYHFIVGSLKAFLHLGARVRVVPFGKFPDGACVLVSNHISHFDPPLLSGWLPRKIDWIAMAELFATKWSKVGFTWLDVIPVDRRGDDRQALRIAIKRLENERMIGIFPEGGIRDGERSILAGSGMREGAFLIAAKAGCPVVPVVILGSERLYNRRNWLPWRRAKVYIAIGDPMDSRGKDRKTIRDETANALIRLKDRLVESCQLSENDLPHSPQERMREP
jgi:1-acyl-sn-glycerol-3-phosphate acyltransferase